MSLGVALLHGWDEWILTGISQRVGQRFLPELDFNDLMSPTVYSYPPFFFWVNGAVIGLFGPGMASYRIVTALTEALAVVLVAAIAWERGARLHVAMVAGILASASLFLAYHETVTVDYMLSCAVLASVLCLLCCERRPAPRWLFAALLLGGLACFVKYHGVVYHAMLCAIAAAWPRTRNALFAGDSILERARTCGAYAAAALFFPLLLLAIEAYTWYEFGWSRTHIAEVFRVMTWDSFVVGPLSGRIERPGWPYYLVYTLVEAGPLVCAALLAGAAAALARPSPGQIIIAAIIVGWFLWASTASLKNARYVLPAVMLAFVYAGALLEHAHGRPGRKYVAYATILLAFCQGAWFSGARAAAYVRHAAQAEAMLAAISEHVPPGATILSEAEWYGYAREYGGVLQPRLISPISPRWQDEADALLTHARAFEMRERRMLYAQEDYLEQRRNLVEEWPKVFDTGTGPHRQTLHLRPE